MKWHILVHFSLVKANHMATQKVGKEVTFYYSLEIEGGEYEQLMQQTSCLAPNIAYSLLPIHEICLFLPKYTSVPFQLAEASSAASGS